MRSPRTPRHSKGFVRGDSLEGWRKAWESGWMASQKGILRIDNPMVASNLRQQWYDGWDACAAGKSRDDR